MLLELALDLVRDDRREQRDALDQRGEDQCRGLNTTCRLGLARHSFGCAATDTADADARADDGEAAADTGADEAEPPAVARRLGGYLEQGVHGHGTLRTVEDRNHSPPRAVRRCSSTRPGPQRASPAIRPDTTFAFGAPAYAKALQSFRAQRGI